MNKSAIALAVAGAMAVSAAVAETTLYGSARVSVDWDDEEFTRFDVDPDTGEVVREKFDPDGAWDVSNNSSRLGVRGSEDLGGGLSAIYQYEFGVDATDGGNFNSNRPRVLGLKGGFGSITMGNQWSPTYNIAGIADTFNSSKSFGFYLGEFRLSNTLVYQTPNWRGFSAEGAARMDGFNGKQTFDQWNVNLKYANGPWSIGGSYFENKVFDFKTIGGGPNIGEVDLGRYSLWSVAGGYAGPRFGAVLLYEYLDVNSNENVGVGDDVTDITGLLEYKFGNNIIRGSYSNNDFDGRFDDIDYWQAGFQHNLSKRSRLWVEYIYADSDDNERETVSIGMRHDF